jgi:Ni,Fe-hydrogenase I large subunit
METINEFCNKLESLNTETNKTIFLENYKECQDKINKIEEILTEKNNVEDMSIKELINQVIQYEHKKDLTVYELKNLKDIIETLETKINTEELNIKIV